VLGSPDLVVEIISPSSAVYDRLTKYEIYEQAGILEYWLVNVKRSTLEIFVLENGHYRSLGVLSESQIVHSPLVPDGKLPVREFFHWDEN
jgi:Uma2 family endonuclease